MKKNYKIDCVWVGYHGESIHFKGWITLKRDVLEAITAEWRQKFYDLVTPQDIAEHIAFNIIVNNAGLSNLDGFTNFPDDYAKIKQVKS